MLDPRWQAWEEDRAEATVWRHRGYALLGVGLLLALLGIAMGGTEATLLFAVSVGVQVFGSIPCSLRANAILRPYTRGLRV